MVVLVLLIAAVLGLGAFIWIGRGDALRTIGTVLLAALRIFAVIGIAIVTFLGALLVGSARGTASAHRRSWGGTYGNVRPRTSRSRKRW